MVHKRLDAKFTKKLLENHWSVLIPQGSDLFHDDSLASWDVLVYDDQPKVFRAFKAPILL